MSPPQTQGPPEPEIPIQTSPLCSSLPHDALLFDTCILTAGWGSLKPYSLPPSAMEGLGDMGSGLPCPPLTPGALNTAWHGAAPQDESVSDRTTPIRNEFLAAAATHHHKLSCFKTKYACHLIAPEVRILRWVGRPAFLRKSLAPGLFPLLEAASIHGSGSHLTPTSSSDSL